MKKKMSFRHALSVHFRAAKALHGVSRRFFPAATLYTVVGAILPYVTVFFSAQILNLFPKMPDNIPKQIGPHMRLMLPENILRCPCLYEGAHDIGPAGILGHRRGAVYRTVRRREGGAVPADGNPAE